MHSASAIGEVYLCTAAVDFRKSIDGLCGIVEQSLLMNPFGRDGVSTLFVFVNRQRTKIKALYWHRNGFCLWYKRLEAERFAWPKSDVDCGTNGSTNGGTNRNTYAITVEQFEWLLEGFDLWRNQPHKTLEFASVS